MKYEKAAINKKKGPMKKILGYTVNLGKYHKKFTQVQIPSD